MGKWPRLIFLLLMIPSGDVMAQKSALNKAYHFLTFDDLVQARKYADLAVVHPQTKSMAKTWFVQGMIFQAMYQHKQYGSLDPDPLKKALEAFLKCRELDNRNEFSDDCNKRICDVALSRGSAFYANKDYSAAFSEFDFVVHFQPGDALALTGAAYAALYAGMKAKAFEYFEALLDREVAETEPHKTNIYLELARLEAELRKDTTSALSTLALGRRVYPELKNLRDEEIFLLTASNQWAKAEAKLLEAEAKFKADNTYRLRLAQWYEEVARTQPGKTSEFREKAEIRYRVALDTDRNSFEANFGLGKMYFNLAAGKMEEANLKTSDLEFRETKRVSDEWLGKALPYLEKALLISPSNKATLLLLKQIYIRKGDHEKYKRVMKSLKEQDTKK